VPAIINLDIQASSMTVFTNFKGILLERYAKDFNTQISFTTTKNQQGLFVSVVSILKIDNEANIRRFEGSSGTKKGSEQSAAELALQSIAELPDYGFVDCLNDPSLPVNTTRTPQSPIGRPINALSSTITASNQTINTSTDDPLASNARIDLVNMLNTLLPPAMSPPVTIQPQPTTVH
jgi:hypothetical protein